ARAIAAKAVIAARVDVYGEGINKTLLEKLNVRVNEISKKYENPTERETRKPELFRREGGESRREGGDFRRREGSDSRREGGDSRREGGEPKRRESREPKRVNKNYRERTDSKVNKNKKRTKFERR
ncbi:MAG: ribonucleotide-diphosphate reductase subunit beta, partial [Nitrosarchaeum sp.]|nr:ribonucleotide-diphosphate reductase subunit beta [Nitrosarchaeum sp.]